MFTKVTVLMTPGEKELMFSYDEETSPYRNIKPKRKKNKTKNKTRKFLLKLAESQWRSTCQAYRYHQNQIISGGKLPNEWSGPTLLALSLSYGSRPDITLFAELLLLREVFYSYVLSFMRTKLDWSLDRNNRTWMESVTYIHKPYLSCKYKKLM